MSAALIERRPRATDPKAAATHHAVVTDGKDVKDLKTQRKRRSGPKPKGIRRSKASWHTNLM